MLIKIRIHVNKIEFSEKHKTKTKKKKIQIVELESKELRRNGSYIAVPGQKKTTEAFIVIVS